jgi:hypothetical protein
VGEGAENPFAATFTGTCVHAILESMMVAPPAERTSKFFDTLVIQASDVLFALDPEADNAQLAAQQISKSKWVTEMTDAGAGYFDIEDPAEVVIADLNMPELPRPKPTNADTLEGAAVAVAEVYRDLYLAQADFRFTAGLELDCNVVVLGGKMSKGELTGGVPSSGFVDRVVQAGEAEDGTPLLRVEDDKADKLPNKRDESVPDRVRTYVLMLEELTGVRPAAPRSAQGAIDAGISAEFYEAMEARQPVTRAPGMSTPSSAANPWAGPCTPWRVRRTHMNHQSTTFPDPHDPQPSERSKPA